MFLPGCGIVRHGESQKPITRRAASVSDRRELHASSVRLLTRLAMHPASLVFDFFSLRQMDFADGSIVSRDYQRDLRSHRQAIVFKPVLADTLLGTKEFRFVGDRIRFLAVLRLHRE